MSSHCSSLVGEPRLPPLISEAVCSALGPIGKVTALTGMGYGRAFKVKVDNKFLVVKYSPKNTERIFYQEVAESLSRYGIRTPKLLASGKVNDLNWIALEFIAKQLPRSRWRHDIEVIATVAKLHKCDLSPHPTLVENSFEHEWDESLIDDAITFWQSPDRIRTTLEKIRREFSEIFKPANLVSGDPSGRNWGLDESGELVLFDWERVGYGTPSLDLMAVAFGEPEQEVFDQISKTYLRYNNSLGVGWRHLSQMIQAGRVHITLKMVRDYQRGQNHLPDSVTTYFHRSFPHWLTNTFG